MDEEQSYVDIDPLLLNKRKRSSNSSSWSSMKVLHLDPYITSSYQEEGDTTDATSNRVPVLPDSSLSPSLIDKERPLFIKEGSVLSGEEEDLSNYRRFSGRAKKQTEFFVPKVDDFSYTSNNKPRSQQQNQRLNQVIRRALRFNKQSSSSNLSQQSLPSPTTTSLHNSDISSDPLLLTKKTENDDVTLDSPELSSSSNLSLSTMLPQGGKSKEDCIDSPLVPPAAFPPFQDNQQRRFPIGTLVWGKLPGYEWWPGCIISYDRKDQTSAERDGEGEEGEEKEEGRKGAGDNERIPWVKWFGDNQLSQLAFNKMHLFSNFTKHLSHTKLKGLYKKALFTALKEAAKRCCKEFVGHKADDRKPSWIFHSSLFSSLSKTSSSSTTLTNGSSLINIKAEETPLKTLNEGEEDMEVFQQKSLTTSTTITTVQKEETELNDEESPLHSPDSSTPLVLNGSINNNNLFTPLLMSNDKSRHKTKSGQLLLTSIEKDLLEWALGGFLPTGPEGFNPRPEDLVEIKVVPVPSSCHGNQLVIQQTKEPSTSVGGVTREGDGGSREGSGEGVGGVGGGSGEDQKKEETKLILVHMKNKAQFDLIHKGQLDIEDICIACGRSNVITQHPLFHGGLCMSCKEIFMESAYLFDDDGSQMYCTICSDGNQVFMCDTPSCSKVYCSSCIEKLCGPEERLKVQDAKEWKCYVCEEVKVGLLRKRDDWDRKLHDLFLADNETEYAPFKFFPPISAEGRKPLRVLGLFDGVGTGYLVLKELGFEVEAYVASEIDPDAIKVSLVQHPEIVHMGAIERLTEEEVRRLGPFDLVFGGSPCNDLSIVNPARKGIYDGTGRLFFEFFRVLSYARPHPEDQRPFFWLYENVVSMRAPDKKIISRFLQCNPVVVDARDISAAHRARYFWGNIPGMNRPTVPLPGDKLTLQECLEPNCFRQAQFDKLRTITTKMNSIKQTKKAIFPVRVTDGGLFDEKGGGCSQEEDGDVLWCTEMERLFGFPDHYTDVANLGRCGRQKLLGKAWSVPVIRHLLSPLKEYFQSNTTRTSNNTTSLSSNLVNKSSPQPSSLSTSISTTTTTAAVLDDSLTNNNHLLEEELKREGEGDRLTTMTTKMNRNLDPLIILDKEMIRNETKKINMF